MTVGIGHTKEGRTNKHERCGPTEGRYHTGGRPFVESRDEHDMGYRRRRCQAMRNRGGTIIRGSEVSQWQCLPGGDNEVSLLNTFQQGCAAMVL